MRVDDSSGSHCRYADDEASDGEVHTGAALYSHLRQRNATQCADAEVKLREYTALQHTLRALPLRSRRAVLAPVANGLAYFDAELTSTNNLLVLLGDGWFVERSAAQAAEVVARRVSFLQRELQVLRHEAQMLEQRQGLFVAEMTPPTQTTTTATAPTTMATTMASTTVDTKHSNSNDDDNEAAATAALATFDEHDELTEDELIALEHELGDKVDDDALVERVLTERMIAKKEKRMQAELARRRQAATDAHTTTATTSAATTTTKTSYATPADIGSAVAATPAAADTSVADDTTTSTTTTTITAATTTTTPLAAPARRVHFAPHVGHVDAHDDTTLHASTAPVTAPAAAAATTTTTSSPAPPRPRAIVGDIVERDVSDDADVTATLTTSSSSSRRAPRRSLFAQQQPRRP